MPTLANSQVAPPKSWDEFEDIVCSAAKLRWNNSDFTRHGRQGQKQDGVDVYESNEKGEAVGLQCKNTIEGVDEKTIQSEIVKAGAFEPKLSWLYIATTAPTDKEIQKFVRAITEQRRREGVFGVDILFWNDVWHDLTLDPRRVYQHFPHLIPKGGAQPELTHDQHQFRQFQAVLPFEPAIRLLREHDFGGPFHRGAVQPLFDFVETWDQPEKEFLDSELQNALFALYQAARKMSSSIVEKTVPVGNGEFASVYSDQLRAAGPRPDFVVREARELNEQANLFVPIYEDFIRLCRKKLS